MSRSCYSDDYGDEFPGQLELYRANVDRSIASKNGQARLIELRDALEAMPVKALAADVFLQPEAGQVCALGAWAQQKAPQMAGFDGDDNDTADALKPMRWPRLVVMDVVYQNDGDFYVYEEHLAPHRWAHGYGWPGNTSWPIRRARRETDEERYARVLAWVQEHIQPKETR